MHQQILVKLSRIKFHEIYSAILYMLHGKRWADMMKVTGIFFLLFIGNMPKLLLL
jgi:hypothetical protein